MSSKYDSSQGTLLEGFETLEDWTISGGTAATETTLIKEGTNSLKLTSGDASNCIATKTINIDLSTYGTLYFWLYIPTLTGFTSIQVILSNDSGFTNYYSKTISSLVHEGWNKVMIGRDQWSTSGSPAWNVNMVRLRVRINASAGTPVCYYDGMYYGFQSRPKCVISFDDGWSTQYTEGYEYMRRYGFKGSLYLIKQRVDVANYITTAQVQTLFNDGWDVLNHTDNHNNMATELSTQAEVETELIACRDWIISNGWSRNRSELHVAYPNGGYDSKVLAAMANLGMITGRTVINRTQSNEIDNQYLLARQSHGYTASAATYKAYIDRAISDNGMVQLNYHKIVADGTGAADTEVEQAQFRDLIDYLNTKRAYIDVVTMTEWYRGISEARRVV